MSTVTSQTGVSEHTRPQATVSKSNPSLHARALARLRQYSLERRLATGDNTTDDRALTVRAWQISRPAAREQLATALDQIIIEAEQPRRSAGSAVTVCREEVEVARDEIKCLASRLRDSRPVDPRGVAAIRQLVTDGASPLYVPSTNDELYRQMHRAGIALG